MAASASLCSQILRVSGSGSYPLGNVIPTILQIQPVGRSRHPFHVVDRLDLVPDAARDACV